MYQQLTRNTDLMEVYGSHSFIRAHTGKSKSHALNPKFALRESSSEPSKTLAESYGWMEGGMEGGKSR
ncbi:hypothetical protein IV203_025501 [Nitzschia inconspicua]|uniref:Uncharacterized protein n=1 Tax=Nitzschia inconspicua TaxID=303405 RepID=A0A9K3KA75_9STRA|nr:hypothetical protein IV203_028278 [Nitzschia inconspicua]KAG7362617.1 hypothetical protein IV203_025501 [Nitzschia inconspicua]